MNYKVVFRGGVAADVLEERSVTAVAVVVGASLTTLYADANYAQTALIIPNERLVSLERVE